MTAALLVLSALVTSSIVVDLLFGVWFPRDAGARLIVTVPSATMERMVVVFPGLGMPSRHVSEAWRPYLRRTDALVVVQYARRRMDVADVRRQLLAEIERRRPAQLRVYGASMGGMCAVAFLDELDGATHRPTETVLLLDTSPSRWSDVVLPRPLSRLTWYRGGPLTSLGWWLLCHLYPYPPVETGSDSRLVRDAHRTFASTRMPTLTSQATFVKRFSVPPSDRLMSKVDRVVFVRGRPAGGDPVIAIDAAIAGWRKVFPSLQIKVYADRRDSWHVPIIERPRETVEMIAAG